MRRLRRGAPTLGPVYDKVGLFEVYSSPWFSAVYLLLFVSLIGCIVPRIRVYAQGAAGAAAEDAPQPAPAARVRHR